MALIASSAPWSFSSDSLSRVADAGLAEKLHRSTINSVTKTLAIVGESPHWQALRQYARQVKLHTLTHLDEYLRQFTQAARANGATVSWADTGEQACRQVLEIARQHGVTRVSKAKTMTGEEIHLNEAFVAEGIEPVETDFGEMICQLAGQPPSHVTAPIIQWSIEEVARLLEQCGMVREYPPALKDLPGKEQRMAAAAELVAAARAMLRRKFMSAGMGVSGANFAVAESGTIVLVENEANIRLSTTLPKVHVAIVGIDKLIPSIADLGAFLTLLPVAATGQRQTSYVSLIRRPLARASPDDAATLHIVLLDNGRSRLLADQQHYDLLSCIRCGACMNVCPVYRHVSGHGYNSIYPGPIGAVLTPHLRHEDEFKELPFASSLCGACTEICPVAIPLHERLLEWRERIVHEGGRPRLEAGAFAAWAWLMQHPKLYRAARPPAAWIDAIGRLMPPVKQWDSTRMHVTPASETFAEWWKANRDQRTD